MTDEERLPWLEAQAEEAVAGMYDARASGDATACYSNAKEAFHDAIAVARRLGRTEDADRLAERLLHIKTVFRSQFPA